MPPKKKGGKKGKKLKKNKVAPEAVEPEFFADEDVWEVHGIREFFTLKNLWPSADKAKKGKKKAGKKKK
eukprot:m.39462 g.39462  ORF g.39462 m.39462 type:complete len:69 (-) comp10144_c0_seq1:390-596(-)